MREALRGLGPYFAIDELTAGAGWLPVSELVASPEGLLHRTAMVRAALGGDAVPRRVAVSVAQMGMVARLLAPSFGAAVLERRVLSPYAGWYRMQVGGPERLAVDDAALEGPVLQRGMAEALHTSVIDEVVAPLVAHGVALSVSPLVLWGNVASVVNGSASMVAVAQPDLAPRAGRLASELLDLGALRHSSLNGPDVPGVAGVRFRRRSCCLLYRVGPPGPKNLCGDCILAGVNSHDRGQ